MPGEEAHIKGRFGSCPAAGTDAPVAPRDTFPPEAESTRFPPLLSMRKEKRKRDIRRLLPWRLATRVLVVALACLLAYLLALAPGV